MPGIIPMKLIKCGSTQTRIAQACDRCRSKKIRCDGVRPCCSQCANVGFECKTSDKLSRRAFPRGYTESLEERVRSLEREVRELKDLLDAKDEQLDMLSRIHSFSPYSPPASATSGTMRGPRKGPESTGSGRCGSVDEGSQGEEMIIVGESMNLMSVEGAEGLYMGKSSGRTFVDLLKQRLKDSGKIVDFATDKFFQWQPAASSPNTELQPGVIKPPPRLLSDHLLVSYFQEYHQLFPVLHRPTFLSSYEKLVAADGRAVASLSNHDIAKLFLVFAISQQQNETRNSTDQSSFDAQWQRALNSVLADNSIATVQCLVLAQLYCFARGDYGKLLHYKSLAVGLAIRLGLNHNQRKFNLGALGGEMRKRTFWCVFCLDAFSAAILGLPKALNTEDVNTELPSDIDDEYVSDEGFLPTLPGDSTKISSALALFRASRVLAQVLEVEYQTSTSHEISYLKLQELEDELEAWKSGLAPHLTLEFVNGAPATNVVHSRSPLLVLAYHYIKTLIHRPVVGSQYPHHSSASLLVIRESSKCIIQIIQLLTERKLGFSFCLNKSQVLSLAGFTFLYSAMDSQRDGMLAKDDRKLLLAVLEEMQKASPALVNDFRLVASSVINTSPVSEPAVSPLHKQSSPEIQHSTIRRKPSSASVKTSRSTGSGYPRRAASHDYGNMQNASRPMSASMSDLAHARSLHRQGVPPAKSATNIHGRHSISYESSGLEFPWPLDGSLANTGPSREPTATSTDDWERMLAMIDASHTAHIYGDGGGAIQSVIPSSGNRQQGYESRPSISSSETLQGPPSLSSYDTLSDGSEDLGPNFGEEDGLDGFLGPMMRSAGGSGGGPQPSVLIDDGWM
ncbi:fungal-specific transcription factor domain-containing protein [Geopyxis carbonaria]|nr:fungal-specific transcription factor domain-containing protein [Geopyxis carbonaria]